MCRDNIPLCLTSTTENMACGGCNKTATNFLLAIPDRHTRENFLVSHGIISETYNCTHCDNLCTLSHSKSREFFFRCRRKVQGRQCDYYISARKDTFIGGSNMTVQQILKFCSYWCLLPKPKILDPMRGGGDL